MHAGPQFPRGFRIQERRRRVASLYLRGISQWEIGRQLGVTQQCIAKDVQALEKEWLASAVVDIDAAKAKELARIDRLERVAWRAWRRSCQRKERATTRLEKKLAEDAQQGKTVTSKQTELRDGNPEYLKRVDRGAESRKSQPVRRLILPVSRSGNVIGFLPANIPAVGPQIPAIRSCVQGCDAAGSPM
jgi:hypothetical protein